MKDHRSAHADVPDAAGAAPPGTGPVGAAVADAEGDDVSGTRWTELSGDAEVPGAAGGPGWGATLGDAGADVPGVGPVFDALAVIDQQVSTILELLDGQQVPIADLPEVAVRLHTVGCRVQAAHVTTIGQVKACGVLPPGPVTATAWLRHSHHLTPRAAGHLVHTATWLADHPLAADALAVGSITLAHVTVMRSVSEANDARRDAFAEVEATFVELAAATDPVLLRQVLVAWADNVDPESADEDADAAHAKRRLFLSPVADGWQLDGYLPDLLGAELAAILNELMARALRDAPEDQLRDAASARRADALMDAVRAAAASELSEAARGRAATLVTLPIAGLHTCCGCGGHHHAPDAPCDGPGHSLWTGTGASTGTAGTGDGADAESRSDAAAAAARAMADARASGRPDQYGCTWSVGNGPGQGHLATCQMLWATCDGEITRLVLDPESRPLDIGRATRVIPIRLRRALNARDRGCVIPGCDRPTGWCEAHHVQHWADGGATSVANLVLLCARHHKELHLGHWRITMINELPRVEHIPTQQRQQARTHYRHRHPQAA